MADDQSELIIEIDAGEDFVGQVWWTTEYDEPIPITDPAVLDVKDATGQIAMRFTTTNDPLTAPYISLSPYIGFMQISVPHVVTETLTPGRYRFDAFVTVADSVGPFTRQRQKPLSGYVEVSSRVTRLEDITDLFVTQEEA